MPGNTLQKQYMAAHIGYIVKAVYLLIELINIQFRSKFSFNLQFYEL